MQIDYDMIRAKGKAFKTKRTIIGRIFNLIKFWKKKPLTDQELINKIANSVVVGKTRWY